MSTNSSKFISSKQIMIASDKYLEKFDFHYSDTISVKYDNRSIIWDSCLVLAKYMEKNRADFINDRKIVEIASGTGLLALIVDEFLPESTFLTTEQATVLPLLESNLKDSRLLKPMELTWGNDE